MATRLWIVGTPLKDETPFPAETLRRLEGIPVIVGESRNRTQYLVRDLKPAPETYFLDPPHPHQRAAIFEALDRARAAGQDVALFSDTGMPITFDPGVEVLEWARRAKVEIRSLPSATSWGTAVALSGYAPPYLILGFPPRDTEERNRFFAQMRKRPEPQTLLETPYRFQKLLEECARALEPDRELFLAWELGGENERLLWFPAKEWKRQIGTYGLDKGEFILTIGPGRMPKRGER